MAICATESIAGAITASSTAIGSCTDYVVLSASDYAAISPSYTPSDAALLASAVVAVWAIAWGFRALGFAAR